MKTRRRALGQHFLRNPRILERIVRAVDPGPMETVVEIGPGHGALTFPLAEKARLVLAVEKDPALVRELEAGRPARVKIIAGDALAVPFRKILEEAGALPPVKIAGNLPYAISGPFLARFWEERALFSRGVFLLQREVAARVAAGPGSKDYAPLGILLQIAFDVAIALKISPGSFAPPPKVDSALAVFSARDKPLVEVGDERAFRRFLRAAFARRRKTLANNLAAVGFPWEKTAEILGLLGRPPSARAEEIDIPGWAAAFAAWRRLSSESGPGSEDDGRSPLPRERKRTLPPARRTDDFHGLGRRRPRPCRRRRPSS